MEKIETDIIEQIAEVNWVRPDMESERGEIERVVIGFLGLEPSKENVDHVIDIINKSETTELTEELWASLENTDSYHNVRPGHFEDARQAIDESNSELASENKRDFKKLLRVFENGHGIEIPTIIKKDGILHLVSGNTRLMICRASGIKPKVIIGEYK